MDVRAEGSWKLHAPPILELLSSSLTSTHHRTPTPGSAHHSRPLQVDIRHLFNTNLRTPARHGLQCPSAGTVIPARLAGPKEDAQHGRSAAGRCRRVPDLLVERR